MFKKHFANLDAPLSNSSSRSQSRVRTPQVDGEENGMLDFNFQSIEEVLATRLDSLQLLLEKRQQEILQDAAGNVESNVQLDGNANDYLERTAHKMNQVRIQSGHTTVNDIISSLGASRTDVSSQSREMLLAQLYKLIVSKPLIQYNEEQQSSGHLENYVTEEKVSQLLRNLVGGDYRSSVEFLLLFRSCIALICSDIEEFGSLVSSDFLEVVLKLIQNPPTSLITNENKASIITGLCSLLMILHNGSSTFGIDDRISWLLDIAEGYAQSSIQLSRDLSSGDREYSTLINDENEDKRILLESQSKAQGEAGVAISALHGCAALLTLLPRGNYLNEFISDMTSKLVDILDNDVNLEISRGAGRVIALCYEIYNYSNDKEDNEEQDADFDDEFNYNAPYYEQEQLLNILGRLSTISTKKVSKKDKKATHSIFRDILTTIEAYTDVSKRLEIYKRSPTGIEIISTLMDSNYIKLSKSKSLPINSWFLYVRLIHLKWCFSFGVHNELVGNETIRDILREPKTEFQDRYGGSGNSGDHYEHSDQFYGKDDRFVSDDYKRTNAIRKARANKLADELDELELK